MAPIKSPLLRTFVAYYGNIGYQFTEIDYRDFLKCFSFILNILIFVAINATLLFKDPWKLETLSQQTSKSSPFVGLIVGPGVSIGPYLMSFNMLYYFFNGRKIIKLLESSDFYLPVFQHVSAKLIFVPLITLFLFLSWFLNPNEDNSFFIWLVIIANVSTVYINYFILHYYQYANKQILKKIEQRDEESFISLETVKWLHLLALLNRKLRSVMSFPLLLSLLLTVSGNVSIICFALVLKNEYTLFLYLNILYNSIGYFYLVYLAFLNRQVQNFFKRIHNDFHKRRCDDKNNEVVTTKIEKSSIKISFVTEIDLYTDSFAVNIFGLLVLNCKTLFSTALFCLCLIVFIFQTK